MSTYQRVFITGGASGIGRLAAQRFAARGSQVIAVDVNAAGLQQLAKEQPGVQVRELDITDHLAVNRCVEDVEKTQGPIDILINCAAIMPLGLLAEQDVTVMHRLLDINVKGTININKAILPFFLVRKKGVIVNFASVAGWVPCMYFGAYDATKFAVVAFSEVLYHENRHQGLQVCCVCPPPVKTPMLLQANIQPKILDEMEVVTPEQVLDALDKSLAKNQLFCFPGKLTRLSVWLRRWFPAIPWATDHRAEGF